MLAFNPPAGSFVININNRKLIDSVLENALSAAGSEVRQEVVRVMDKWEKLPPDGIDQRLSDVGLSVEGIDTIRKFMTSETAEELLAKLPWLAGNPALLETQTIMQSLIDLGYQDWVRFQPNIIRGFDYYDGMVFEVFDRNPDNNRAMFGGGRYNGLASLFGGEAFPAVGFAPGDETTKLFLESWNLLDQVRNQKNETKVYVPLLSEGFTTQVNTIAKKLRAEGKQVVLGLEVQKFGKALDVGNKISANFVVIFGEDEAAKGVYLLKDMQSGGQSEIGLNS